MYKQLIRLSTSLENALNIRENLMFTLTCIPLRNNINKEIPKYNTHAQVISVGVCMVSFQLFLSIKGLGVITICESKYMMIFIKGPGNIFK